MTTKSKLTSESFLGWLLFALLIISVVVVANLGYKTYNAAKFCQDKGHANGHYKAYDGEVYSCVDYTEYKIQDK